MAHPTCAHARPPDDPPSRENSSRSPEDDLLSLAIRAFGEMKAMREAYQAVSCFHDVVEEVRAVRGSDYVLSPRETRALMALDAEFKHRVQTVKTTLADMRSR